MEQSRSESQVLVLRGKGPIAVMMLIKRQRILAKLIETSTELLHSKSAAFGGLARSEGGCCFVVSCFVVRHFVGVP